MSGRVKRPFQFSLKGLLAITAAAGLVAWLARHDSGWLLLVPMVSFSLLGAAIGHRRVDRATAYGGIGGAFGLATSFGVVLLYIPGPARSVIDWIAAFLAACVCIGPFGYACGAIIGAYVGLYTEEMHTRDRISRVTPTDDGTA